MERKAATQTHSVYYGREVEVRIVVRAEVRVEVRAKVKQASR